MVERVAMNALRLSSYYAARTPRYWPCSPAGSCPTIDIFNMLSNAFLSPIEVSSVWTATEIVPGFWRWRRPVRLRLNAGRWTVIASDGGQYDVKLRASWISPAARFAGLRFSAGPMPATAILLSAVATPGAVWRRLLVTLRLGR